VAVPCHTRSHPGLKRKLEMMMQIEQDLRDAVAAIPAMLDYLSSFDSELVSELGGARL
jgi:hypothetical protein